MTDPNIWDKTGALARLNNKSELLQKIMSMFFDSTPEALDNLQASIQQDDREQIKAQSHTLKGQSATVGAERLAAACFAMEQQHDSSTAAELEQQLSAIRDAFQEFQALAANS